MLGHPAAYRSPPSKKELAASDLMRLGQNPFTPDCCHPVECLTDGMEPRKLTKLCIQRNCHMNVGIGLHYVLEALIRS